MADCLTPPPPSRRLPPSQLYEHLEAWARDRGIEVLEADFGPGTETERYAEEHLAGVVATRGTHFVAVVDRTLDDKERALTLAHELSHILSEFGPTPPRHGVILDARGNVEPRAYATEALFGLATGLIQASPGQANSFMTDTVERLGMEPFVIGCELSDAAKGSPRSARQPPLGTVGYR